MNAIAAVMTFRHCTKCHEAKAIEEFSPKNAACKACRRDYAYQRAAEIKAGTWSPLERAESIARARLAERPKDFCRLVSPAVPVEPGTDEALHLAMLAYFIAHGFTALRLTTERLEGVIGRTHRLEVAREGWIA